MLGPEKSGSDVTRQMRDKIAPCFRSFLPEFTLAIRHQTALMHNTVSKHLMRCFKVLVVMLSGSLRRKGDSSQPDTYCTSSELIIVSIP